MRERGVTLKKRERRRSCALSARPAPAALCLSNSERPALRSELHDPRHRAARRTLLKQLIDWRQGPPSPAVSAAPAARSPAAPRRAADPANAILTALRPVAPAAKAECRPQEQNCPLQTGRLHNKARAALHPLSPARAARHPARAALHQARTAWHEARAARHPARAAARPAVQLADRPTRPRIQRPRPGIVHAALH